MEKKEPSLMDEIKKILDHQKWCREQMEEMEAELEEFYQRKKADFRAMRERLGI